MPPMRTYLQCTITNFDGVELINELKLSEIHLISKLTQENKSVLVERKIVIISVYESIFN